MSGPVGFGIVLAGGRGRRMQGMPKHLCRLGGRTLLEHAIARAAPQVERLLLSCNDPDLDESIGVEAVLADPVPGFAGPLAGVLAGLEYVQQHAPGSALLSIAIDTPWFPRDLAQRLADACATTGADLAVAASGGTTHAVFALWPLAAAPALRLLLESGANVAVRGFQARHRTVTVEWAEVPIDPFLNINTPAELAEAEMLLRHGRAPA